MKLPIYLDYSATTPVDARVAQKMGECLTMDGNFGNPASRSHVFGWKAEEAVENARRQALAAANDLIRVYSMLDIKLNRGLLDNIMLLGLHHAVDPLEAGAERENWEIP